MIITVNQPRPIIVLVLPSLVGGGMERVMSELAIYFATEKKATVHLVLLGIAEKFYKLPPQVKIHEPSFVCSRKMAFLNSFKTMWYLRNTIGELKPDAVLSFGEMYNSFVLLATIFTPYKIFVSDRSRPDKNWGRFHHLLRNLSYRRAAGIISQTNIAKKIMFGRMPHRNIKVIGNPIKAIQPAPIEGRKNIILTVGRIIKSKRIDLLIRLFDKTDNENWQLHILGDGPEKAGLESLVASMKLNDKVVFLGRQNEVAAYYATAKIFAFTSNSEGFPNVLGEAMSAGLAPVTFNFVAGAGDLVTDNKNGFLVPMNEDAQYIKWLNTLMHSEILIQQMAAEATASIKKFDTAAIANEYYNFILS